MAIQSDQLERAHPIREEHPVQVGPFKLNYKLFWGAGYAVTALIGFTVLGALGLLLFAAIWVLFFLVTGALLVILPVNSKGDSIMTVRYRKISAKWFKRLGMSRSTSDQPELGEIFGLETAKEIPDKSVNGLIGRVDFEAFELKEEPDDDAEPTLVNLEEEQQEASTPVLLGIAHDRRYGTLSSTMWAMGTALTSMDPEDRAARIEAYDQLLQLVVNMGPAIDRFVIQQQTLLGEPQHPVTLLETLRKSANLGQYERPGQDQFVSDLRKMGEESVDHVTRLSLSVDKSAIKRLAKELGGPEYVLVEKLRMLYNKTLGTGVGTMDVRAAGFYPYEEMLYQNRMTLDPVFIDDLRRREEPPETLTPSIAWPKFWNFEPFDHCWVGSTAHMGFYLNHLPRGGVTSDRFWELQKVRIPKTITTVIHPLSTTMASLGAEYRATGAKGANVDRSASAQRVTAAQKLREDEATEREMEVARQLGRDLRMRTYYDVTGRNLKEVRENAALLLRAAHNSSVVLEPLTGRQHLGIEVALRVGRGLSAWKAPKP